MHASSRGVQPSCTLAVHFASRRKDAMQALRERCRQSPSFYRLLELAAYHVIRRGYAKPVLTGSSPRAERALLKAINVLSQKHAAQIPEGKAAAWCYLTPKSCRIGGRQVQRMTQVDKAEAVAIMEQEATLDGFQVRTLLGYAASISREAAERLMQLHGAFYLHLPAPLEPIYDSSHDLDPNDNEHFRDDRGFYDEAGVLQSAKRPPEEAWETGYATREEAWNQTHAKDYQAPKPSRFYPAPAAKPVRMSPRCHVWHIDQHGVSCLLEFRQQRSDQQQQYSDFCKRQQRGKGLPDAPLYEADLSKTKTKLLESEHLLTLGRRAQLDADEAEVLSHSERDVPETIVMLLEQQVEELTSKAPKGLMAALAWARLETKEQTTNQRLFEVGMSALEAVTQCEPLHVVSC